uniref:Retrotransposon gag domain-containing protein n=1 Tax=Fagus sylvatica TaxID=28930 RepID=A0A2N9H5F5_FAGSY
MAGETSGPGPSEQEIRMVALERKFDELLSFVQLIGKRNPDDENQRKEDDKDTNEGEPEGHSNTNATPPPPTPPKPEGKDSQLDSKIDSLEEKIRLMQGLNSFGNTDFSSMSWFPNMTMPPKFKSLEFEKYNGRGDPMIHLQMYCQKMAPYVDNEPLLIQTFQNTLTGQAAEWMEKKSNETFREYAQRWREKAARARPPLDEREMIKIFVDTLKNPYFDRMIGLQMQFFVDLIPVGKRIEDVLKTKKIVDMTALMALAEQATKKAPMKKKEGDVQMIGRSNGRPKANRGKGRRAYLVEASLLYIGEAETHHPVRSTTGAINRGCMGIPCEYGSGKERGHSLECCEEFKEFKRSRGRQPGRKGDEGDDWGYFMEDDTDEWRNVDFSKLFQFPCLIAPPGFKTPEFEIFYENGNPGGSFAKVRREDGLTLGERAFDDLGLFGTVPLQSPFDSGIFGFEGRWRALRHPRPRTKDPDSTAIAEEGEEPIKTPPPSNIITTTAEEEYAGPMVEGLSIHTIAEEEDSTTPPTRHCQQGEEAKMWTCVPLLQRVSSSNE